MGVVANSIWTVLIVAYYFADKILARLRVIRYGKVPFLNFIAKLMDHRGSIMSFRQFLVCKGVGIGRVNLVPVVY